MTVKDTKKTVEATVEEAAETTVKKSKNAMEAVKKGAAAAKQSVSKIASLPGRVLDSTVYGTCYGISYGAVFSALMVTKILPTNGLAMKGFHDGADVARKDFTAHEETKLTDAAKSALKLDS